MLTTRAWIPAAALIFSLIAVGCSKSSSPDAGMGATSSTLKAYGLSASASDSTATLSWPSINGASAYNLYWSTRADISPANATKITDVTSPYSHAGLSNGTAYYYRFSAVTAAGESAPSTTVKVTPKLPRDGAPAKVSALAGDGRITLVWDAVPNATTYSVYWNTTGDVNLRDTQVAHVSYPAVHTGLTNGQQYYYIVTAETQQFGVVASAEVSTAPHIAVPSPPLSVSVSAGDQRASLSWPAVSDATAYALYWNNTGHVSLADHRIDVTTPNYTHSGLTNNTRYFYRVAALNAQGPSVLSAEVTAKPHIPAPGAPGNVTAAAGNEEIILNWDPVTGASQYNLYWDSGADAAVTANVKSPFVHKPLTGGVAVNYVVTALRDGVESTGSAPISATPLGLLPSAPAGFNATPAKQQITLTWAAVDGALGYRVYWHTQDNPTETLIITGATPTPSYTHTGLLDNTTYFYRIEAITADGISPAATASETTLAATAPASTGPPPTQIPTTYTVGGTVSGLAGSGLALTNNGMPIPLTGTTFSVSLPSGSAYNIAVSAQPLNPVQNCSVANGTGTMSTTGNISNVTVNCTTVYTVTATAGSNGTISPASQAVAYNTKATLTVNANVGYMASVSGCGGVPLANVTGTTPYTTAAVVADCTVSVSFAATSYTVSVTVSGLTGGGLVVTKVPSDSLTFSADATLLFATLVASGSSYTLTITTNPTGQTCLFSNSTGATTDKASNVPEAITCKANPTYTSKINDTGVTANQCYQTGSDVLVACNSSAAIALNPAQDGMIGRDVGATNGNTDGKLGFSISSVPGGCVQDNITGLMWEVKTTDGGLRDWAKTYTNYNPAYNPLGLYDTPTDTSGFITAVNATNLCGFNDWHLPTPNELQSIVDFGIPVSNSNPVPAVDANWFANTQWGFVYWSTTVIGSPGRAWAVAFLTGNASTYIVDGAAYVRLVRAGQLPTPPRYTVSTDGQEVTDRQTNLIWRRCAEGMGFNVDPTTGIGTCTGTVSEFTHEAALIHARDQASVTGTAWRMPSIKELASIADTSLIDPAIDAAAFPATPYNSSILTGGTAAKFWSATPDQSSIGAPYPSVWTVYFGLGAVQNGEQRISLNYMRLVRAGQ